MPDLTLGLRFGGFAIGLGFAVPIVPLPETEASELLAQAAGCDANPGAVACANADRS